MGLITGRQSRLKHPSTRLYHGECRELRDAVRTYLAALRYEEALFTDDDEFNRESKALFNADIRTAESALAEYDATIGVAERALFERWAASDSTTLQQIGKAGLAGDYTPLAI